MHATNCEPRGDWSVNAGIASKPHRIASRSVRSVGHPPRPSIERFRPDYQRLEMEASCREGRPRLPSRPGVVRGASASRSDRVCRIAALTPATARKTSSHRIAVGLDRTVNALSEPSLLGVRISPSRPTQHRAAAEFIFILSAAANHTQPNYQYFLALSRLTYRVN